MTTFENYIKERLKRVYAKGKLEGSETEFDSGVYTPEYYELEAFFLSELKQVVERIEERVDYWGDGEYDKIKSGELKPTSHDEYFASNIYKELDKIKKEYNL